MFPHDVLWIVAPSKQKIQIKILNLNNVKPEAFDFDAPQPDVFDRNIFLTSLFPQLRFAQLFFLQ